MRETESDTQEPVLRVGEVGTANSRAFSFAAPVPSIALGASESATAGLLIMSHVKSNDEYRRVFVSLGIVGGEVIGLNADLFWSSPTSDRFNAPDRAVGGYFRVGEGAGLDIHAGMSYGYELHRSDVHGHHAFPFVPSPQDVARDLWLAVSHDYFENPIWHLPSHNP